MASQVRLRIGISAAFDERQAHHSVMDIITILAVVRHGHTVVILRKIRPFVGAYFKFRSVPRGVFVGRTLNGTVLDFVDGFV